MYEKKKKAKRLKYEKEIVVWKTTEWKEAKIQEILRKCTLQN